MLDTSTLKQQAPDLLMLAGQLTSLKKISTTGSGEWAGACPFCGGRDRFRVQPYHRPEARWLCRNCTNGDWKDVIEFARRRDNSGFMDAVRALFGSNVQLSPERAQAARAEMERKQQAQAEQERAQLEVKRAELNKAEAWKPFYENLDKLNQRPLWRARGLSDFWQDYFKVGYSPNHTFYFDNQPFQSPSLTIPTFRPSSEFTDGYHPLRCEALVHRLLTENPQGGKYRPHLAGCGKPLFWCDEEAPRLYGPTLIVEGEIKAMVTWAYWNDFIWNDCRGWRGEVKQLQVVGIAGKNFRREWDGEFEAVERIWICMDPDASKEAQALADLLGKERCRILDLSSKIDDMLVSGVMSAADLHGLMITAKGSR